MTWRRYEHDKAYSGETQDCLIALTEADEAGAEHFEWTFKDGRRCAVDWTRSGSPTEPREQ